MKADRVSDEQAGKGEASSAKSLESLSSPSRRKFLGNVGGVTAAAGVMGLQPLLGQKTAELQAHEIAPGEPTECLEQAFRIRVNAAQHEKDLGVFPHHRNGDEELYAKRIGNFHKTMRHNKIGEVNTHDYSLLLHALDSPTPQEAFLALDRIPKGGTANFLNPVGGLAFNIEGPDSPATSLVVVPPPIASAEKTAEMAEVYWQAFLRDVPFTDYNTNAVVQEAADDLTRMSGYLGPRDADGRVTPQLLFRYGFPGATDGPITSQILYRTFFYDGVEVVPRMRTREPVLNWDPDGSFTFTEAGRDFLTSFHEWLAIQNGVAFGNQNVFDPTPRFIRSVRDLGHLAGSDIIYSSYFRAALVLGGLGAVIDEGNPYNNSKRQAGFATFGLAHLTLLIGSVHKAERHTWYDKWNVHRHLRPESYGGLVDNFIFGRAPDYPIPSELLDSPVLHRIAAYNEELNRKRFGVRERTSFLLPQELPGGSPAHPSAPAGHAVAAGACVTILKAWFKEDTVLSDAVTVQPNRDGTALLPYVAGVDGPPLTVGGELNKLAHNLSAGRDMSGVHWRIADDLTGLFQGEEVAIRILREARPTYPEPHASFTLTRFNGETITI
jgi:hypothetical protein